MLFVLRALKEHSLFTTSSLSLDCILLTSVVDQVLVLLFYHGEHPGQASVVFLPIIDLNPSDLVCIFSTLHFVCDHASRYDVTPILTFD